MKKIFNKKTLDTLLLIGLNWTIFAFLVAGYTLWVQHKALKIQEAQIKECQEFNQLVKDQMKSGRILIELRKEE